MRWFKVGKADHTAPRQPAYDRLVKQTPYWATTAFGTGSKMV